MSYKKVYTYRVHFDTLKHIYQVKIVASACYSSTRELRQEDCKFCICLGS